MVHTFSRVLFVAMLAASCLGDYVIAQDSLRSSLTDPGLLFPGEQAIPLLPPSLTDSQSADEQQRILEDLAGKLGWERFSKKSAVAPVTIKLEFIKNAKGERVGHSIHTAFVAYAQLDKLRDAELMELTFGPQADEKARSGKQRFEMQELDDALLKQMKIERQAGEGFGRVVIPLLNRVVIRGVIQMQTYEGDDWVQLYWRLDPRWSDSEDPAQQNSWTKKKPNELGKLTESAPVSYEGCGGYLSVRTTGKAQDQILVETRMAIYEPSDWFAGSNYLRSKLPLSMQESARTFRRKMMQ